MNVMALCAGVGAMELGLEIASGGRARTVCYVERDAYAAAVLVARMEDKALEAAPIWDDIATFDGGPWRGVVDCITAGLPCQPYSLAGKQRGHADERAIWPEFVRVVEEAQPAIVFIENVPKFLNYFEPVWRELRRLGFGWAPPLLQTAGESGAPHMRRRFFALATHPDRLSVRIEQGWIEWPSRPGPARSGLEGWGLLGSEREDQCATGSMGDETTNSDRERLEGEWCGWVFDAERETLRHDSDRCSDGCRIRETYWSSESPVLRVDDGPPNRVDELRTVGNVGAPPVAYASAFLTLLGER